MKIIQQRKGGLLPQNRRFEKVIRMVMASSASKKSLSLDHEQWTRMGMVSFRQTKLSNICQRQNAAHFATSNSVKLKRGFSTAKRERKSSSNRLILRMKRAKPSSVSNADRTEVGTTPNQSFTKAKSYCLCSTYRQFETASALPECEKLSIIKTNLVFSISPLVN